MTARAPSSLTTWRRRALRQLKASRRETLALLKLLPEDAIVRPRTRRLDRTPRAAVWYRASPAGTAGCGGGMALCAATRWAGGGAAGRPSATSGGNVTIIHQYVSSVRLRSGRHSGQAGSSPRPRLRFGCGSRCLPMAR